MSAKPSACLERTAVHPAKQAETSLVDKSDLFLGSRKFTDNFLTNRADRI